MITAEEELPRQTIFGDRAHNARKCVLSHKLQSSSHDAYNLSNEIPIITAVNILTVSY